MRWSGSAQADSSLLQLSYLLLFHVLQQAWGFFTLPRGAGRIQSHSWGTGKHFHIWQWKRALKIYLSWKRALKLLNWHWTKILKCFQYVSQRQEMGSRILQIHFSRKGRKSIQLHLFQSHLSPEQQVLPRGLWLGVVPTSGTVSAVSLWKAVINSTGWAKEGRNQLDYYSIDISPAS